ncbi:MAG: elongation factor P [Dethiobacteria bacterium]|nr:elongation factor P [Bacillota bacterium]MDW7728840.1 elongation factor P [Bacillota bacterium]
MISTNDFHTGVTIEMDGDIFIVLEFQHVKPGKGQAFVRSKLKNMRTGSIVDKTFRAGEKMPKAHLERKEMEYLYRDDDTFHVMDTETYEQTTLLPEQIGDGVKYLKENDRITVVMHGEKVVGVEVPLNVNLKITETEPGLKGDTASGATKPATVETGVVVMVPLFINEGDTIKIDTRTGSYIERV